MLIYKYTNILAGALETGPGIPSWEDLGATWKKKKKKRSYLKYVHYFKGSSLNPSCGTRVPGRRGGSGAYGLPRDPQL